MQYSCTADSRRTGHHSRGQGGQLDKFKYSSVTLGLPGGANVAVKETHPQHGTGKDGSPTPSPTPEGPSKQLRREKPHHLLAITTHKSYLRGKQGQYHFGAVTAEMAGLAALRAHVAGVAIALPTRRPLSTSCLRAHRRAPHHDSQLGRICPFPGPFQIPRKSIKGVHFQRSSFLVPEANFCRSKR